MTERRVRRRPTTWLVVALLGAATALTAPAPAGAATTCTLTFKANWIASTADRHKWIVEAKIANTGTASSTTWETIINFPANAVIASFWSATRPAPNVWQPVEWNNVIPRNGAVYFGFDIRMPLTDTTPPVPPSSSCSITY
uniref:cellulose binding domain-containing protein n=1 Tax=Herbidospora sakaeratensis TaxID=564415 RepID=UPI0009FF55EB|nr:cellulose binding domain-containing protein [Herbidospora sakaeratensis]